jgi:iron-sulfur cluster repair protein YtfE (RIC family)
MSHGLSNTESRPVSRLFDGAAVLDACHRETLRMLEELSALVTRLDTIGADASARSMATEIHAHFSVTMREHHEDEERHVFPRLAASGNAETRQAIELLSHDHSWLDVDWRQLSPVIDAIARGQTWYDIDVLREGVEIFSALSRDHIALEEYLVYPQVLANLDTQERSTMDAEMAARRSAHSMRAARR